jgi:hypothetical protein
MFGRLIGKIVSAPLRIVNVPIKVMDDLTDPNPSGKKLKRRDPLKIDEIADTVEDALDLSDD